MNKLRRASFIVLLGRGGGKQSETLETSVNQARQISTSSSSRRKNMDEREDTYECIEKK